jgi:lycopene beta-cyclase
MNQSIKNSMSKTFDYIFVGNGASTALLIHAMNQRKLFIGRRVLILDGDAKTKNDRTFCFWADDKECIVQDLAHLIKKSWSTMELSKGEAVPLDPFRYHFISGLDLYDATREIIQNEKLEIIHHHADIVASNSKGKYVIVNGEQYFAQHIFDSRPPKYFEPKNQEVFMLQSFVGWFIKTERPIENVDLFRWMDFDVEQNDYTQFMYVLPFDANNVLVELTRFGKESLTDDDAFPMLHEYIEKHFGDYEIKETELAAIPMTNCAMSHSDRKGVTLLGARAGMLKPTTGYAFKMMHEYALRISEEISKQGNDGLCLVNSPKRIVKRRFEFYDALLLIVLTRWPQVGKDLFSALLHKVSLPMVMRFLEHKTSLKEELNIFYQLPWRPFLKALLFWGGKYYRQLGIFISLLLIAVFGSENFWVEFLSLGILLLGLIAIGIPHGALDHLVESCVFGTKRFLNFLGLYLLMMGLMATIWMFHPTLALLIFLIYSAIHFGQTDGIEWGMSNIVSWIWGGTLLFYILGSHQEEASLILASLGYAGTIPSANVFIFVPWFLIALYHKQWSMFITLTWLSLTAMVPLIYAFGLYFIFQHSALGWGHLRQRLKLTHFQMWKQSLVFQLGAWIFLLVYMYYWPLNSMNNEVGWSVFFIFLSSLSFPHVLAMLRFYNRNAVTKI